MRGEVDISSLDKVEQPKHRFKRGINIVQSVSGVGDASVHMVRYELENADEDYSAGVQESKKYTHPVMDAMAVAGARETAKGIQAELNQLNITANRVNKLVQNGTISMVDLGDKKLLKERLEAIEDLSKFQKWQIRKFRELVYDMILIHDAIERKKDTLNALEEPLRKHLESADFFNLRQQKTNELLKLYFQSSGNDVLQNVSPASMSEKDLSKLLKTKDKNGFSDTDMAALRLVKRQSKLRESRIHAGQLLNVKRRIEMLGVYSNKMDGTTAAGLSQIGYSVQVGAAIFSLGKFALKTGIVTASFAAKYTGVSYLLQVLGKKGKEAAGKAKEKIVEAAKESKPYQAVNTKVQDVKASVYEAKESLEQMEGVKKYREIQKQAKTNAKTVSKKVNQTKAAAKSVGRTVKQGKDIVLSPVRLVGRMVNGVRKLFHAGTVYLFGGVAAILVAFLLIVVMTNAVLGIFQAQAEAAASAILMEDEGYIEEISEILQEKSDEKRTEAKNVAEGTPKNTSVLEGHTISKYGYPDGDGNWIGGSKIVYLDGSGNVTLNGMNNIKDCIVMAYIIMDGDFDSNEGARDELIKDLWELMNPSVSYKESDIYTCLGGCDNLSYSCDNSSDYTTINNYKSHGVGFYGDIESYSAYGDSYTVTCDGCKDSKNKTFYHETQTGSGAASPASGCTNYSVDYDCSGHSVTVCYGHKNVEVYVTVSSMEEMFSTGLLPDGTGEKYQSYLQNFSGWTEDNKEWARNLIGNDWYELYGCDPSGGTGYTAGRGMTAEEIQAIIDTYGSVDATRTEICSDAMSFVGRIPYYWGGKAIAKEYEQNGFYATVTPDYKGRNKNGLDCSGFVQWIVWRVTDVKIGASTSTITAGMEKISASELQPGDLGLMAVPGTSSNHVGIFVGYNESGQALWCHENASAGNVSVNNTTCFRYFYKII